MNYPFSSFFVFAVSVCGKMRYFVLFILWEWDKEIYFSLFESGELRDKYFLCSVIFN